MSSLFQNLLQKLSLFLPFLLFLLFVYKILYTSFKNDKNTPPSPPKLPIIGNLHQLGSLPHRSLHSLSQLYGDLMLLHLGSRPTLVVSSPDMAQQIMKTHDKVFSNRPKSHISSRIFYDGKDIAFSSYGEYWRRIRSVCVLQLLSNKKVQSFRTLREQEASLIVEKIMKCSNSLVNLREIVILYTNDVICRASLGRKFSGGDDEGSKFKKLLNDTMRLIGYFSFEDMIPWLGWIDRIMGLKGEVEDVAQGLDEIIGKVVIEYQNKLGYKNNTLGKKDGKRENIDNFVEILLQFQKENNDIPVESIKAIILDMFAAGTDTTQTLIEWTIIELIRLPRAMKQVKEEIRKVVGGDNNNICEEHLEKLTYLKAVVKESLRLHPPAPLLVFHESSEDVKLNGFDVAAGTQVIINAWAIHRDPSFWEDPEEFRPERFLNNPCDFTGQYFHYIPFGAGRRICPGISFGLMTIELLIANLIYEFDWKFPSGIEAEKLDMTEAAGLTVGMRDFPMAIATPCLWR
ncbi:unnamed protein product [Amaranthus hypochondriacus]